MRLVAAAGRNLLLSCCKFLDTAAYLKDISYDVVLFPGPQVGPKCWRMRLSLYKVATLTQYLRNFVSIK